MDSVRIPIVFDGEWIEKNRQYSFTGTSGKGLIVHPPVTYEQLLEKVARAIGVKQLEYDIALQYQCITAVSIPPFNITSDEDVEFFIGENCSVAHRTPLCVTYSPKLNVPERVGNVESHLNDEQPHISNQRESHVYSEFVPSTFPVVDHQHVNEGVTDECNPTELFSENKSVPDTHPILQTESQEVDISLSSSTMHVMGQHEVEMEEGKNLPTVHDTERPIFNSYMPRLNAFSSGSTFRSTSAVQSLETIHINERVGDSCGFMVGELLESKEDLKTRLSMYALQNNFQFKTVKSGTDIYIVECVKENCKWRIRATRIKNSTFFRIKKAYNTHTCSVGTLKRDHRQAGSKLIAHTIKHKYKGVSSTYSPGDIQRDVQKQLGFSISYHKAWRARELALQMVRGSPEESFMLLSSYNHMLMQKNRGTLACIETDSNNRFKYYFMSIGSCMRGFRDSIRPVIAIDNTFLKGKYKGTLFVASCLDGNNQIYPLAFGVGDSENDAAWEWFLTKLRIVVDGVQNLVIISDCHASIRKGVANVFPSIPHGICMYHLSNNIRMKFKEVEGLVPAFALAAKTYRTVEFQCFMDQITSLSATAAEYLYEARVERWARSHFEGRRYSIMTTNIAECLNDVLKDAHNYPIHKLIDHIRELQQTWFEQRRRLSIDTNTRLTPWAEEVIRERASESRTFPVQVLNSCEYIVRDPRINSCHVNLQSKECSCCEWQFDQLPCRHVLAVCRHCSYNYYDLCSPYYSSDAWIATYAETIYPVGPMEEWNVPEEVSNRVILPSLEKRRKGRPKDNRIASIGEEHVIRRCGRCGGIGHNKRSCNNQVPLPDITTTGRGQVSMES